MGLLYRLFQDIGGYEIRFFYGSKGIIPGMSHTVLPNTVPYALHTLSTIGRYAELTHL